MNNQELEIALTLSLKNTFPLTKKEIEKTILKVLDGVDRISFEYFNNICYVYYNFYDTITPLLEIKLLRERIDHKFACKDIIIKMYNSIDLKEIINKTESNFFNKMRKGTRRNFIKKVNSK